MSLEMWKTPAVTALLLAILPVSAVAQDARTVVEDASRAMGAAGLNAIVCSGVGAHAIYPDSVFLSVGSSFR